MCPTYPNVFVVPADIPDSVLTHAAKFRSKGRISVLSYVHPRTHASLTRCSQPLSGISGMQKRNASDEELIRAIFSSNSPFTDTVSSKANLIFDARPKANAYANAAIGKGFETPEFYQNCTREFLGIDNIHVMRDSLSKLVDGINSPDVGYQGWAGVIEASGWLKHVRLVLEGAVKIAKAISQQGSNVLVHCSDGWDRTAQLTGLAQLLMDPYYRTIRGFEILVEKEWLSMGFKFEQRCGHLARTANSPLNQEVSPVFSQFFDCVWQIMQQFPDEFEFTDRFLVDLHRLAFSCEFGTFLKNCERERRPLKRKTQSAWTFLNSRIRDHGYLNPLYREHPGLLLPEFTPSPAAVNAASGSISPSPAPHMTSQASPSDLASASGDLTNPDVLPVGDIDTNLDDDDEALEETITSMNRPLLAEDPDSKQAGPEGATAKKEKEDEDETESEEEEDIETLGESFKGRDRSKPVESVREKPVHDCLIPPTLPSRIKIWRKMYCPNDFEPAGEMRVIEREVVRLLEETRQIKEKIEGHKDTLDPSRVERRRAEEERSKKAVEQRRQERRVSSYNIDTISSLEDDPPPAQED